jgi:hypothetical protein
MISWKLILLGLVVLVVGAILIEMVLRRGIHRPLAHRISRPKQAKLLGMEATDEARVAGLLQRNSALAAKTGAGGSQATWSATCATTPAPYPDDETYAARYIGAHEERNK